jgi:hypothetical protein
MNTCKHDVAWALRTWCFATGGMSLNIGEIAKRISENLAHRHSNSEIKRSLAFYVQRGPIRHNSDGTFSWLGAQAR